MFPIPPPPRRYVQGCMHKDSKNFSTEVDDGGWLVPKECTNCTCTSGRLVCARIQCDCTNDDHVQSVCCAHCNAQASCAHQELPNVRFRSGQQWIYQCQTCECLVSAEYYNNSTANKSVFFFLFIAFECAFCLFVSQVPLFGGTPDYR